METTEVGHKKDKKWDDIRVEERKVIRKEAKTEQGKIIYLRKRKKKEKGSKEGRKK